MSQTTSAWRTEAGAKTHAVLASVLRTLSRQGRPILVGLMGLLRHGSGGLLEFDHVRPPDPVVG